MSDRCLSGNTAEAIQKVDPEFIKLARIDQSLTPGRNNGFLNMLKTMKTKALELEAAAKDGSATSTESVEDAPSADESADEGAADSGEGPKFAAITEALQALKPESLTVTDKSEVNGGGVETHFELQIVASAFEGLNVIKRQQLVFMMLGEIMPQVEGLQIVSMFTPEEAEK